MAGTNILFPRDLSITWGNDPRYWKRTSIEVTSNAFIEVAELLEVCWLEVKGEFNTKDLTPGIFYQVAFLINFNDKAVGWKVPVNLKLDLPNGTTIQRQTNFVTDPRNQWKEIVVGEFRTLPGDEPGNMKISLAETSDDYWKKGLLINGVVIRPVN